MHSTLHKVLFGSFPVGVHEKQCFYELSTTCLLEEYMDVFLSRILYPGVEIPKFPNSCPKWLYPLILTLAMYVWEFNYSTSSSQDFLSFSLSRCLVASHCGFSMYFPTDQWCWTPFHVFWPCSYPFLTREQDFYPFFSLKLFVFFLLIHFDVNTRTW